MSLSQTVVLNGIHITKTRVPLRKNGVLLFGYILTPHPPNSCLGQIVYLLHSPDKKGLEKTFSQKGEREGGSRLLGYVLEG